MSNLTSDIQANQRFSPHQKQNNLVWGFVTKKDGYHATPLSLRIAKLCHSGRDRKMRKRKMSKSTADFEVLEIPLDIFVEDWLLTLSEDGVLDGTNQCTIGR